MQLSESAYSIVSKRYLLKDSDGNVIETPEDMLLRVSKHIASAEVLIQPNCDPKPIEDMFFSLMDSKRFLPNSPTLLNAGRPLGQLSACFVLPFEDSIDEIFDTVKAAALIHKSGGGTGFSLSRIRQNHAVVKSTGGEASGPISFMQILDAATQVIRQGGVRRGANIGVLRVDHPDILEFIHCKDTPGCLSNFNISVAITESFWLAVENDEEYDLIDPHTKNIVKSIKAKRVFDEIIIAAHRTGEPGIVFLDRINEDNPTPKSGDFEATNPCGEQPLLPYESCNLGSINLVQHLTMVGSEYKVDWDKLRDTVRLAIRFLDNAVEVNKYPLYKIRKKTLATRKIGLGVMGFADILLFLRIPYNSSPAVDFADALMQFINKNAHEMSHELAVERGTFPAFANSIWSKGPAMRNATVTTIAPTGTISIIAGVSNGIEPIYAYACSREISAGNELPELCQALSELLETYGLDNKDTKTQIIQNNGIHFIKCIPDEVKRVFVTAHDITPEWHVRMQAAFQRHVDNAVSKTINLPENATLDDVRIAFKSAHDERCKGITIYRDNSRPDQPLSRARITKQVGSAPFVAHHFFTNSKVIKRRKLYQSIEQPKASDENTWPISAYTPRKRPSLLKGSTERFAIGCGNLYVTVNMSKNHVFEIFTSTGTDGGCPSQSEATARLASIALRSGVNVDDVTKQLKGIRCPSTVRKTGLTVSSCPDAIAHAIENAIARQNEVIGTKTPATFDDKANKPTCPQCHYVLEFDGGCSVCRNCGYSKCNG